MLMTLISFLTTVKNYAKNNNFYKKNGTLNFQFISIKLSAQNRRGHPNLT